MKEPKIPIIDLHAHFPMQLRIPPRELKHDARNRLLFKAVNRVMNFQSFNRPRVQLDDAFHDGVSFGSVLYNPADEFCVPDGPFENVLEQVRLVESRLDNDNRFRLVRSPSELEATVKQSVNGGPCAVFHCIEGGFAARRAADVESLARTGVAYITLAHLFFRDISTSVNPFPCLADQTYRETFYQPEGGLTIRGEEILEAMRANGIIPDITHMTRAAIDDVLTVMKGLPVIASHTAVRALSSDEYLINIDNATIDRIDQCGGLIGIIFYDHWLTHPDAADDEKTIDRVIDAIDHVMTRAGEERMAIGSDLDGFIKPVKGLENFSKFDALRSRLLAAYGQRKTERILWQNVVEVFKVAWRRTHGL